MFNLGFPELILILVIALIFFGPGKLPSVGSAIGKAVNEFKKASREIAKEDHEVKSSQNNSEVKEASKSV